MIPSNENNHLDTGHIWKNLAIQAQAGDKQAYSKLLHDLLPYIKNVVRAGLSNPDWAEDIAQEVLISVHKSLYTYSPDRDFKPWLMAIINFRKTDFLRAYYKNKKAKESVLESDKVFDLNVTNPQFSGELGDVNNVLQSLPRKQRRIFEMIKIEGYSAKEVANEMGMSESAVKVSAHRTLAKLKEKLA